MNVRVSVDQDVCIGSANCINIAPDAFALDEDGVAHVLDAGAASEEQLRHAERACPTGAILVEDAS